MDAKGERELRESVAREVAERRRIGPEDPRRLILDDLVAGIVDIVVTADAPNN